MSAGEKAHYWRQIKERGIPVDKHYRDHTTAELRRMLAERAVQDDDPMPESVETAEELETSDAAEIDAVQPEPTKPAATRERPPGLRPEWGEPLEIDADGTVWYQMPVAKPAFPKPRGRRVLKYVDPGVVKREIKAGQYVETVEVPGERTRPGEIKITLPSYQVGIYKDRRFPFRIHVYNDTRGFNLFDVQDFYGGAELVPRDCKRIYVENVLCYDIRTVVRSIQAEHRQNQLKGA